MVKKLRQSRAAGAKKKLSIWASIRTGSPILTWPSQREREQLQPSELRPEASLWLQHLFFFAVPGRLSKINTPLDSESAEI